MADTTAEWSLSLDTECPQCKHNFDLLHELVDNASSIEVCETGTVATRNYETACQECGHEFTCDFVY
ncbi:hypothetical protein [Atlantibacter hermannii]|uniref:hypothetical protein n=1 Tax=Atlantibacter hermannii TaxID=565 RepID=UPI00289FEB9B|nr:hypothetical protein [Atlantibacter hermannii]